MSPVVFEYVNRIELVLRVGIALPVHFYQPVIMIRVGTRESSVRIMDIINIVLLLKH